MENTEIQSFIANASLEDLDRLIREAKQERSWRIGHQLKVGTQVKFNAKTRGFVTGRIVKINPKNVKVLADNGMRWNVSPTYLTVVA